MHGLNLHIVHELQGGEQARSSKMSDAKQEHTICYRQHRLWVSVCRAQDEGLLQGWHLDNINEHL